jgi:hypothetical protein
LKIERSVNENEREERERGEGEKRERREREGGRKEDIQQKDAKFLSLWQH